MKTILKIIVLAFGINLSVLPMETRIAELKKCTISELNKQLLIAASNGNFNEIEPLVSAGANVNHLGYFYTESRIGEKSPLMIAAKNGHESMCTLLLSLGADLNLRDDDRWTPLLFAIEGQHESICKLFLEHGAKVETQISYRASNCPGLTPLGVAALRGRPSICRLLLESDADINAPQSLAERSILTLAANGEEDEDDVNALEDYASTCRTLITCSIFNPIRTKAQLRTSQQRMLASLCAIMRICPHLNQDAVRSILSADDLEEDVRNCALFIHAGSNKQSPVLPMQVVRLLIQKKLLDPEQAVAAIKAQHIDRIKPLMQQALAHEWCNPAFQELLNPDDLEANYTNEIEATIRRRLGLSEQSSVVARMQEDKNNIE